ncbi:MAG TPA: HK97-gp10 family putative phage morphogenesis protein [Steroidobacteraceae bacterium]
MADEVEITFNDRDLVAALREFTDTVARKIVRASLRQIASVIQGAIAAAAPRRTGKLADNIAVTTSFSASRGIVKSRVIVRTEGKAGDARNAFYWRFVNFGHRTRPGKHGAQHEVAAQPFVTQAGAQAQNYAADQFFSDLEAGIDRQFTRQA